MTATSNTEEIRDSPRNFIRAGLIPVLLVICSSFFASYNSNSAYNTDEVWSIHTAALNFRSEIAALQADVHPPLYFLMLHSWTRVFGEGERAVRSLSGLFYVLSVLALFALGRKLYGTRTALLCAVIYLTSPLAILAAQFARMYSLLSLLAILSTWLYLQFTIKTPQSNLSLVLYVAVNILGTFTHIAFFFLLFAQIAVQLIRYRRVTLQRFLLAIAASLLPYAILWGPTLLRQLGVAREGIAWVKRPGPAMLADLLLQFGGIVWLTLPLFFYFRRKKSPGKDKLPLSYLPAALLAITLLTPLLISFVKPVFNPRLAIVGLPLFALALGTLAGRRASYLLTLSVFILSVVFFAVVNSSPSPCDNRTMASYLNQNAADGDVVIFTSLTRLPIDYYLQRSAAGPKLFETSFPAEIDQHPGYEGNTDEPARRAALADEARALVEKIVNMPATGRPKQIFFFHGRAPEIDAIIARQLDQHFKLQVAHVLQCGDAMYFRELSVYK